jgi:hypothetical protein
MGKTIYAGIATSVVNAQTNTGITSYGYFRQYQLLVFGTSVVSNNTFGVGGSQAGGYAPYLTFYLPSIVAGRFPAISPNAATALGSTVGGQA